MGCGCDSGIRVRGGPNAAREARQALTGELAGSVAVERMRDLLLVVSEIVNNSVLHGEVAEDGWIAIQFHLGDSHLRVEVRDTGSQGEPEQRDPNYEQGGGFGLFIVDVLSSSWGVEHEPDLTVWFELALD